MDYAGRLEISYYNTIATIDDEHKVYLVQHRDNRKIYIKKVLDVYNIHIYEYLQSHCIAGIPKIHSIYEENGQLTIVEDYISGTPLSERIDSHALSVHLIIQLICELCNILGELHRLHPPIIHRDIKPSNIMITQDGHVVLIDFNAAKYLTNQEKTDTVLLGTQGYAAPEQYGFGSSTPKTDIYAVGVLLKELVAALPTATDSFDAIIDTCTQMNPSDRIENVYELKAKIRRLNGDEAASAKPVRQVNYLPPGYRTKTPWKMFVASMTYFCMFCLSISLAVKDVTALQLWIERVFCLCCMLAIVFCCFDYGGIQSFVPLCRDRRRYVRYLGILLLNIGVVFSILIIMTILVLLL